jgi:hypothetical protein
MYVVQEVDLAGNDYPVYRSYNFSAALARYSSLSDKRDHVHYIINDDKTDIDDNGHMYDGLTKEEREQL